MYTSSETVIVTPFGCAQHASIYINVAQEMCKIHEINSHLFVKTNALILCIIVVLQEVVLPVLHECIFFALIGNVYVLIFH